MQPQNCCVGFCTSVQIHGQLFSRAATPLTMRWLGLLEGGFCGWPQVSRVMGPCWGRWFMMTGGWIGMMGREGDGGVGAGATTPSSWSVSATLPGLELYCTWKPFRLLSSLSKVCTQKSTTMVGVVLLRELLLPDVMVFWTMATFCSMEEEKTNLSVLYIFINLIRRKIKHDRLYNLIRLYIKGS